MPVIIMRVMALFQIHFLQNACVPVRMAPGQGHLCHIDTFLVVFWRVLFCFFYHPLIFKTAVIIFSLCFGTDLFLAHRVSYIVITLWVNAVCQLSRAQLFKVNDIVS